MFYLCDYNKNRFIIFDEINKRLANKPGNTPLEAITNYSLGSWKSEKMFVKNNYLCRTYSKTKNKIFCSIASIEKFDIKHYPELQL